jgi:hypothetical protein
MVEITWLRIDILLYDYFQKEVLERERQTEIQTVFFHNYNDKMPHVFNVIHINGIKNKHYGPHIILSMTI